MKYVDFWPKIYLIVSLSWKLDHPYCHTVRQEIYGLVGIAFETYGTGSETVTRFINIQSHRKWIETVKWAILGKKKNIFTLYSRSEEDDPNDRELELNSNTGTSRENSGAMIWVDLILTLLYCLELLW